MLSLIATEDINVLCVHLIPLQTQILSCKCSSDITVLYIFCEVSRVVGRTHYTHSIVFKLNLLIPEFSFISSQLIPALYFFFTPTSCGLGHFHSAASLSVYINWRAGMTQLTVYWSNKKRGQVLKADREELGGRPSSSLLLYMVSIIHGMNLSLRENIF